MDNEVIATRIIDYYGYAMKLTLISIGGKSGHDTLLRQAISA